MRPTGTTETWLTHPTLNWEDTKETAPRTNDEGKNISSPSQLLGDETTLFVMQLLMFYVTPAISVLGALGNVFSIIILVKHGLDKCSNILLFCLAVTDLTFLISFNSVPKVLYEVTGEPFAWAYSESASCAAFVMFIIFNILDYAMGYISLTIPMLITIERLIAVFMPLKFHQIMTPKRTWGMVGVTYCFWYSYNIYSSFWFEFGYEFRPHLNISVGLIQRSPLYYRELNAVSFMQEFVTYSSMKIPPVCTLLGCIIISAKIRMASVKRKKLTSAGGKRESSSSSSSTRTTKMLLAVCAVYTVTCAILSLPTYIPQYAYYTLTGDAPNNVGRIAYQLMNIIVCVNSSCNFVVYVGMNKKFRDTYKSLLCCSCRYAKRNQNARL
ncbi:histamine H2 receptor-like [Aplysia californica]|uniref:Histamine H2 receptor-like n=1 Tax=Aplysia californica TaxID=6500 RepID=A0ABM0JZS6_APLCA|nr:histamine H2 receptor-like [Aplysia californica]